MQEKRRTSPKDHVKLEWNHQIMLEQSNDPTARAAAHVNHSGWLVGCSGFNLFATLIPDEIFFQQKCHFRRVSGLEI